MKVMVTGRRRDNQSWAEMKAHMLDVHGPLVAQEAGYFIKRYVQNQVRDGVYGPKAPYGRDMVAEVTLVESDGPPPAPNQRVRDDEANFAHLDDRFYMLAQEQVLLAPPEPPGRTELARGFKALNYLKRREGASADEFAHGLAGLDGALLSVPGLKGCVRSTVVQPPGAPPSPYDAVVSVWFDTGDADAGFKAVRAILTGAGIVDADLYFAVFADEHVIVAG